jgi:hypothetical protein
MDPDPDSGVQLIKDPSDFVESLVNSNDPDPQFRIMDLDADPGGQSTNYCTRSGSSEFNSTG